MTGSLAHPESHMSAVPICGFEVRGLRAFEAVVLGGGSARMRPPLADRAPCGHLTLEAYRLVAGPEHVRLRRPDADAPDDAAVFCPCPGDMAAGPAFYAALRGGCIPVVVAFPGSDGRRTMMPASL